MFESCRAHRVAHGISKKKKNGAVAASTPSSRQRDLGLEHAGGLFGFCSSSTASRCVEVDVQV